MKIPRTEAVGRTAGDGDPRDEERADGVRVGRMPVTTQAYQREEGTVRVTELGDGRLAIEVEPAPGVVIARPRWVTHYPIDLIEAVLEVKGAAWVCDEIMRDEDPGYVRRNLAQVLEAYAGPWQASVGRVLDFGCGCGSSTVALAAQFPNAEIVGVELLEKQADLARRRLEHHEVGGARVLVSPSGDSVPDDLGLFDLVCLSAVYEHLLPGERPVILGLLSSLTRVGGTLLVFETPDRMAFVLARRFSARVDARATDADLLREGLRGATAGEITRNLRARGGDWERLDPTAAGVRHPSQIWYRTAAERLRHRPGLRAAVSWIDRLRLPFSPYLALAYRKRS